MTEPMITVAFAKPLPDGVLFEIRGEVGTPPAAKSFAVRLPYLAPDAPGFIAAPTAEDLAAWARAALGADRIAALAAEAEARQARYYRLPVEGDA